MPELPELDVLVANLAANLLGARVATVLPLSPGALKTVEPPLAAAAGRKVTGTGRRAKYIWLELDGLYLVMHLSLGGRMSMTDRPPPRKGGVVQVEFDDGRRLVVTEGGTQRRAAVWLVEDPAAVPAVAALGPEPLSDDFTPEAFAGILARGGHVLKGMLTDQRLLAGVGNAWSDEALHRARLSPFARPDRLTADDVARLHEALVTVLSDAREALAARAGGRVEILKSAARGFAVHGRAGDACFVCGDTIRSVWLGERETSYCPTCQTGGRVLADRRRSKFLR
jgi:formamidopyrimidine-DNA glycosylase